MSRVDLRGGSAAQARDAGFTLVELLVEIALLGVVLGAVYAALASFQTLVARADARSRANNAVQLAVAELASEVRSGNVIVDPATEDDPANGIEPNMALVVYTQAFATTVKPANRCVEWRIDQGALETRWWSPTWQADGLVGPWTTVATDIVNETVSPQVPAFTLAPSSAYGGRLLEVDVLASVPGSTASPVSVQTSVEGRNTEYGYPSSVCSPVPPGG